jgi:hypothetical protein
MYCKPCDKDCFVKKYENHCSDCGGILSPGIENFDENKEQYRDSFKFTSFSGEVARK